MKNINIREKFIGNISLMLTSTGIRLILGLATIIIIVRHIPMEHFGVYVLIQTIGTFFVIASDFGLNYSASKFIVSADGAEKRNWAASLAVFRISINVIMVLILILLRPVFAALFKSDLLAKLFPFIVVNYVLQSLEYFFSHLLQGFYRYKKIALADVSIALSRLILVMVFIVYFRMGIVGACWSFALSLGIGCAMLLPSAIFGGRLRSTYLIQTAKFAWPLEVNSILSFFDYKVYGLIIAYFLGPVSLALFEAANRIPEHLQRLFEAFRSVFFPQISEFFSKGDREGVRDFVYHAMRVTSVMAISGAFIAGLFHREIITLLFSSSYSGSSAVFFYLMVIMYFYVLGYILWLALLGSGFSFWSMLVHFSQVVVGVTFGIILIPRLGLVGAVLTLFIFYFVPIIILVKLLEKRGVCINRIILIKPLAPFLISYAAFAAMRPQSIGIKALFVVPFVALIFIFSLISKEDFAVVKRVFLSRFSNFRWKDVDDV